MQGEQRRLSTLYAMHRPRLILRSVVSADTVNTFKHRLDKFWSNQDVVYNYTADLSGTRNRSIYEYYIINNSMLVYFSDIEALGPASVYIM